MTATQEPPRSSGLLGSSAIMAAGTVVSRLTGFARAAVIAAAIGLTAATADVFNVPNVLPNMIYILVGGGVLNSVLVPVLVRAIKNDADGGQAYSQRLFSLAVAVLGLATAIAVLAAPLLMRLIVDDRYLRPDMQPYFDNMVMFARFCLPQIFFYGLYVLIGQMLNAKGRFGPMMWSPILNNVVAIAVFGVFLVVYGTQGFEPFTSTQTLLLGLGSTLGVVAQALVLIPVLRKTGFSLRFRTDWRGHGLGESVRLGLWTVAFVVVNQLAYLVVVKVASGASSVSAGDSGAGYSVYANAMLIMMVPHSVITVSLATALLPRLSEMAADGELDEVRTRLISALRMCLAVIVPLGALMAALAFPLTAMIFDYGSAGGQTDRLALTLVLLMPGLVAFTVHYMVLRGFYALQDTKTPFYTQIWVSAVIMIAAVGVAVAAPGNQYVTMALAGGYSLGYLVGAIVGARRLQRRIGPLAGGELIQHVIRLLVHSAIAATLAWLVWRGWSSLGALDALPSMLVRLVELIVGGTVGVATFVGLAYAFRVQEVRRAVALVLAKLRGGSAQPAIDPGDLLEDTAEYQLPAETGTLSIFRRPMDPDMTSEFFLDETLPGVPSFFDTTAHTHRDRTGLVRPTMDLDGVATVRGLPSPLPAPKRVPRRRRCWTDAGRSRGNGARSPDATGSSACSMTPTASSPGRRSTTCCAAPSSSRPSRRTTPEHRGTPPRPACPPRCPIRASCASSTSVPTTSRMSCANGPRGRASPHCWPAVRSTRSRRPRSAVRWPRRWPRRTRRAWRTATSTPAWSSSRPTARSRSPGWRRSTRCAARPRYPTGSATASPTRPAGRVRPSSTPSVSAPFCMRG